VFKSFPSLNGGGRWPLNLLLNLLKQRQLAFLNLTDLLQFLEISPLRLSN
jgi:hypothetical protein